MIYQKLQLPKFFTRITLCLILLYPTMELSAQTGNRIKKGEEIKSRIVKAFGGVEAVNGVSQLKYTIHRSGYGADTSHTSTTYILDLRNKYITSKEYTASDTIVKSINATGAWLLYNGQRTSLTETDTQKLYRVFQTNFIPMLQDRSLVYEYIQSTEYHNQKVTIVRVYTADKGAIIFDLFVAKDGKILTSTKPDADTGKYLNFADELYYKPIGGGLVFPVVYKVWKGGQLTAEGVFAEILVKQ